MELQQDLREFIALLNSADVKYVIVGGYAVAFHGFPRDTGDIDFFVEVSRENAEKISRVLKDFGFTDPKLTPDFFMGSNDVVQFGREPFRIDLITAISGVAFCEVWDTSVSGMLGGLPVKFISKELLVKNKRASGRSLDLADIDHLEQ